MSESPTRLHSVEDGARFTAGDETIDRTTPPSGSTPGGGRAQAKGRPERPIPTDRLRFDNQLEVLRSVASMSGNNRRGVDAETMSAAIGLKGGTGGLNSRFFRAAHWFESVGRGEYTASEGLLAYWRHINVDPEDAYGATATMRGEVRRSWFWETISPMLESGQPVRERALLLQLANAAGTTDHTTQLETIIEWLAWVGLVERDGDMVRLAGAGPVDEPSSESATEPLADEGASTDQRDESLSAIEEGEGPVQAPRATARAAESTDDAIISFNVSVRLTADDVKNLNDDQMAFVMGLAEKLRG